jgi:hypothetical protein
MPPSHVVFKYLRLTHLYIGVFITPALLFFAFTGALQTFSLHETTRGSDYKPPAWAVTLAQIHKKQTPIVGKKPEGPPKSAASPKQHAPESAPTAANTAPEAPKPPPSPTHNPLPLKIFFLLVSLGLFTSTLTGLYMTWKVMRQKLLIASLFTAGIVIPVLMIIL